VRIRIESDELCPSDGTPVTRRVYGARPSPAAAALKHAIASEVAGIGLPELAVPEDGHAPPAGARAVPARSIVDRPIVMQAIVRTLSLHSRYEPGTARTPAAVSDVCPPYVAPARRDPHLGVAHQDHLFTLKPEIRNSKFGANLNSKKRKRCAKLPDHAGFAPLFNSDFGFVSNFEFRISGFGGHGFDSTGEVHPHILHPFSTCRLSQTNYVYAEYYGPKVALLRLRDHR
jgi:hypothetical protein